MLCLGRYGPFTDSWEERKRKVWSWGPGTVAASSRYAPFAAAALRISRRRSAAAVPSSPSCVCWRQSASTAGGGSGRAHFPRQRRRRHGGRRRLAEEAGRHTDLWGHEAAVPGQPAQRPRRYNVTGRFHGAERRDHQQASGGGRRRWKCYRAKTNHTDDKPQHHWPHLRRWRSFEACRSRHGNRSEWWPARPDNGGSGKAKFLGHQQGLGPSLKPGWKVLCLLLLLHLAFPDTVLFTFLPQLINLQPLLLALLLRLVSVRVHYFVFSQSAVFPPTASEPSLQASLRRGTLQKLAVVVGGTWKKMAAGIAGGSAPDRFAAPADQPPAAEAVSPAVVASSANLQQLHIIASLSDVSKPRPTYHLEREPAAACFRHLWARRFLHR